MVYELAKRDKRVVFFGSDVGAGTLNEMKKMMPDRFFMEGVSEAAVMGMMTGMALNGSIVYFNTIATFATRRAYEQVLIDIAMHNLPVRIIGSGGGLVYAPLGPTHLAFDDIAIMRTIPNMTIVAPADATEMERLMRQTLEYPGPIYIRVAKGGDHVVTPKNEHCRIGKALVMGNGNDVLLVTTGITLQVALDAAAQLKQKGLSATILHMHTIKPFDTHTLLGYAKKIPVVLSIEEATVLGGLGSAVAEALSEARLHRPIRFQRIGLPDVIPEHYGSQALLMDFYGINTKHIMRTALSLLRKVNTI